MCVSIPLETQPTLTKRAGLITHRVKSLKLWVIVRNRELIEVERWRVLGGLQRELNESKERREQWSPYWHGCQRLSKREGRAQLSIFSGLKLKGPASSSSVCGRSGRSSGSQNLWAFWGDENENWCWGYSSVPPSLHLTGRLLCPHTHAFYLP